MAFLIALFGFCIIRTSLQDVKRFSYRFLEFSLKFSPVRSIRSIVRDFIRRVLGGVLWTVLRAFVAPFGGYPVKSPPP